MSTPEINTTLKQARLEMKGTEDQWGLKGHIEAFKKMDPRSAEYTNNYSEWKKWKARLVSDLMDLLEKATNNNMASQIEKAIEELEALQTEFSKLPQPGEVSRGSKVQETQKNAQNIEELGNTKPNSNFKDIPLNGMQLAGIEPQRLLAKSASCEYYLVAIPEAGWGIMRINVTDSSDEIAFLPLNGDYTGEQLVQMIRGAEASGGFRDVEIEGSKGTWGDVSAQAVAGAGLGGGIGHGAGAITAIPTAGLSLPVLGGIGGGVGGLVGAVSGALTDEDFTPADLEKFGLRRKFDAVKTNPKS